MPSQAWNYFDKSGCLPHSAKCTICKNTIKTTQGSTRGLWLHLQSRHNEQFKYLKTSYSIKAKIPVENATVGNSQLATIFRPPSRLSSEKKNLIDNAVLKFIINNFLPFQTVSSDEFKDLLNIIIPNYQPPTRQRIANELLDSTVKLLKEEMKDDIKEQIISITSDGWSSSNGKISIYSVTAHYINHNFERKNAVLAAVPANEMKHTSTNISKVIEDTIQEFNLTLSDVGAYIHDSAANMRLSAKLLGVESSDCLAHLYHLVIGDAINSVESVEKLVKKCRKIAGHFNRSSVARQELKRLQNERNYPVRQILQDITTRWNSLYFSMVEILKQLPVINKYASVYQPKANLPMLKKFNDMEKELLKQVVHILSTFQKHSTEICKYDATLCEFLPRTKLNHEYLDRKIKAEHGVGKPFLQALKSSMEKRFSYYWSDALLMKSTLLDPRYAYSTAILTESEWDASEFSLVNWHIKDLTNTDDKGNESQLLLSDDTDNEHSIDQWRLIEENDRKRPVRITSPDSTRMYQKRQIEAELERYRQQIVKNIRVQISNSPLIFWKANSMKFPILSKWARIYLGCPPTSVSSERLFSRAGLIFNNKLRTRISGARGEKCLLIAANKCLHSENRNISK